MARSRLIGAHNFAYLTKRIWNGHNGRAEENAVIRAERLGAVRVESVTIPDVWIDVPGDVAFGLWQWPDGSRYCIADNGHMIHPAHMTGRHHRPLYVSARK